MSYNITAFRVKEINDLTIPITEVLHDEGFISHRGALQATYKGVNLQISESTIKGTVNDIGELRINSMNIFGEGSGYIFEDIICSLLKKSSGQLKAILVWEGGDTIEQLSVNDGTINRKEAEL